MQKKTNKKHKCLLIPAFILSTAIHGQITKSNWMVGGNGEFYYDKTTFSTGESSSSNISISPKIGYFIKDKFVLGLFGSLGTVTTKTNALKTRYSAYGIGPFTRYYFLSTEDNINLLFEINGAYNEQSNSSVTSKSSFISYSAMTGPVIFLNTSVGVEFLLGYKGYKETKTDVRNGGVHFNIGIQVHLEKES